MLVLKNDMTAYFDVDDTLVMWGASPDDPKAMQITSKDGLVSAWVTPHERHIKKMIEHKVRGQLVVVWSAGGWDWAHETVKKLGLSQYVDLVIAKPQWAWDDLTPNEFIRQRCYINPKTGEGR